MLSKIVETLIRLLVSRSQMSKEWKQSHFTVPTTKHTTNIFICICICISFLRTHIQFDNFFDYFLHKLQKVAKNNFLYFPNYKSCFLNFTIRLGIKFEVLKVLSSGSESQTFFSTFIRLKVIFIFFGIYTSYTYYYTSTYSVYFIVYFITFIIDNIIFVIE